MEVSFHAKKTHGEGKNSYTHWISGVFPTYSGFIWQQGVKP
jgi:hypothetical protein